MKMTWIENSINSTKKEVRRLKMRETQGELQPESALNMQMRLIKEVTVLCELTRI